MELHELSAFSTKTENSQDLNCSIWASSELGSIITLMDNDFISKYDESLQGVHMPEKKDNQPSNLIRVTAYGIFTLFWLWRFLAGTLLGALVGGIIFLMLDQGYWAKVSFSVLTLVGLGCGLIMAESARKRAKGSIPVMEHVYSSHDLDKK